MELEWVRIYLENRGFATLWQGEEGVRKRGGVAAFARLDFQRVGESTSPDRELPFYLYSKDLESVSTGTLRVFPWMAWSNRPAKMKNSGDYFRLVEKSLKKPEDLGAEAGPRPLWLVLPGAPVGEPWRTRLKEYLEAFGVAGVLSLRSIMHELMLLLDQHPERLPPGHSAAGDLLHLLKFYDLLKDPQMELF